MSFLNRDVPRFGVRGAGCCFGGVWFGEKSGPKTHTISLPCLLPWLSTLRFKVHVLMLWYSVKSAHYNEGRNTITLVDDTNIDSIDIVESLCRLHLQRSKAGLNPTPTLCKGKEKRSRCQGRDTLSSATAASSSHTTHHLHHS